MLLEHDFQVKLGFLGVIESPTQDHEEDSSQWEPEDRLDDPESSMQALRLVLPSLTIKLGLRTRSSWQ